MQKLLDAAARAGASATALLLAAACGGGSSSGLDHVLPLTAPPVPAVPVVPVVAPVVPSPAPSPGLPVTFQAAETVLGQPNPDIDEANQGQPQPGSHTMFFPVGLALTPTGGLLVTDAGNHRVLLFDSVPTTTGASAVEVLGQPGFETAGRSLSRSGLNQPSGVAVRDGRMVVADPLAHRVLVYDRIPGPGAEMPEPVAVIGQPGFESGDPACTRAGLAFPSSVFITRTGQLIVADAWNHRVLVWDAVPATQEAVGPPTQVVGQRLLNSCIRNDDDESGQEDFDPRTGLSVASARTLRFPSGVWSDGIRLVVADTANHRVLV
ncbi:NHL repeat-containing protein [Ramlibacter sp. Leaf400]|uniref:NHL repeat-containing protein n=1 Tax=Ramlibacter sp. Leaf400 TaxID=1736365 RepID=UPI001F3ED201|nr:NHL repeat-containing protein [Ramlibacter sp. Leaf400]